jgi:hypothetical protein
MENDYDYYESEGTACCNCEYLENEVAKLKTKVERLHADLTVAQSRVIYLTARIENAKVNGGKLLDSWTIVD